MGGDSGLGTDEVVMSRSGSETSGLQRLPIIVGVLGGGLLVINRILFTPELVTSQSRADVLGLLLSAILILTGLLWQQVQPQDPESVELQGKSVFDLSSALSGSQQVELGWASKSILSLTAARSLMIWWQDRVLLRRGIFRDAEAGTVIQPGAILKRTLGSDRSVYLVDLKLFPAKAEFTAFLPTNTQGVLCQPIGERGVLILGMDTPRSLTKRDQAWIEAIAQKLDHHLESDVMESSTE